jgi:hypothetical protein
MTTHIISTRFGPADVTTKQHNRFDKIVREGRKFVCSKNTSSVWLYWKRSGDGYTTDPNLAHDWEIVGNYPSDTYSRKVITPFEAVALVQNQ